LIFNIAKISGALLESRAHQAHTQQLTAMNATTENPDDWRKREIMRLLLGLLQIIGVILSIWLLVTAGLGWLSGTAIVITIFFFFLSRLRLLRN
jgi:uncharacterized membrane protein